MRGSIPGQGLPRAGAGDRGRSRAEEPTGSLGAVIPGRFGAVLTAMVTPFDEEGVLDVDAAADLASWLVDHGSDGLVVAGRPARAAPSMPQSSTALWRAVAEAVTVPVVAGDRHERHSPLGRPQQGGGRRRRGRATGGDALLQAAVAGRSRGHFEAVASVTDLPVLLYDIPVRTGRRIDPELMVGLATTCRTIVGVKDATGDLAGAPGWRRRRRMASRSTAATM